MSENGLSKDAQLSPIALIVRQSMFWKPNFSETSAWLEYVPFSFWIVDVLQPKNLALLGGGDGVAYLAFCQGVDRLGLNTRCVGVDIWQDDDLVFDRCLAYNNANYSSFSRLMRGGCDEGLKSFNNGSIDLLCIDVPDDYETLKLDFEAWFPKLSDKAVVLFHGVNIRDEAVGVFKYYEEMKGTYPWFEFSHGRGMGVLRVGKEQSGVLGRFFDVNSVSPQAVREAFACLGRACVDSLASRTHQIKADELTEQLDCQRSVCVGLQLSLEETQRDVLSRKQEVLELKAQVRRYVEQVTQVQENRQELNVEVSLLRGKVETAYVRLAEKGQELNRLSKESADFQREIYLLAEQEKVYVTNLEEKERELGELSARLNQAISSSNEQKQTLEGKLHERFDELTVLTRILEERGAELRCAHLEAEVHLKRVGRLTGELANQNELINGLRAECKVGADEKESLATKLNERFDELAILTNLLAARDLTIRTIRLKSSLAWRADAPRRALLRVVATMGKKIRPTNSQVKLIASAGLFDTCWYLERYPDVAIAKIAPIEHYLRFGAEEGRDPGPGFHTRWYLRTNRDVEAAGVNPLVHYIKFGMREGRLPMPK